VKGSNDDVSDDYTDDYYDYNVDYYDDDNSYVMRHLRRRHGRQR